MSGLNWTEEEYREYMARFPQGKDAGLRGYTKTDVDQVLEKHGLPKVDKLTEADLSIPSARRKSKAMNRTEQRYALILEARKAAGEVQTYYFEGITFKLDHDCRYTPDFIVRLAGGELEAIEVKAGWKRKSGNVGPRVMDGAGEKFKWAREKFPMFRFRMVYLWKGNFEEAAL
jgi:hypothetical protein